VTRGRLPQSAGSLGLNGGGTAAAVPRQCARQHSIVDQWSDCRTFHSYHITAELLKTHSHMQAQYLLLPHCS